MNRATLQIQQLNKRMLGYTTSQNVPVPAIGWIKSIRAALGISMQQLGSKLSISKQAVQDIEKREQQGAISLKALRETAQALDMQLVYGFVPKDGSLDELINRKAKELAIQIVTRTSNSMKLEDQENSKERIEKAIEERVKSIKEEMPKALWD